MNNLHKRFALFLLGCIPVRFFIVYLSKIAPIYYLRWMGVIALMPAFGFLYIYFTGSRKRGVETMNAPIWWNELRPIHAALYIMFALNAIRGIRCAWIYLFADVCLGLFSFLLHHFA